MNNIATEELRQSIYDYLYFINKDYPVKPIIKIVSDKYRLTGIQRSILFRGVTARKNSISRKSKIIGREGISGKKIIIDVYNVLITIASYLEGKFVYIALDGLLRDTSESHGRIKGRKYIDDALMLIIGHLKSLDIKEAVFVLDSPVSKSREFAQRIKRDIILNGLAGNTIVTKSADSYLKEESNEVSATSDSSIVDKINMVYDLAYRVLHDKFSPNFFDIEKFLNYTTDYTR